MVFDSNKLVNLLPLNLRRKAEAALEVFRIATQVRNPTVLAGMAPSVLRGMFLQQGKQERPTQMLSGHTAHFDFSYHSDFPEMRELYRRAKANQWDSEVALDWSIDVDPLSPDRPLMPVGFFNRDGLEELGVKLTDDEVRRFTHDIAAWMISQFLHGEQGALFAAAQVTESVQWMDGKLYGATQVVDEGRHVETFHRYLEQKLEKLYVINDNLFVIIDALMTDSRWDMKFLGMQIMVEGLALGSFGTLYRLTREPLLKALLGLIIQDEARHVHYGVLALKEHIQKELSERERREREDWAFEVALLIRNRFLAHEVFEEWFEGLITRQQWNRLVETSPGMREFRSVMFSRLVPNLRFIGLLSDRVRTHYGAAGLLDYYDGANASQLTGDQMLHELDTQASFVPAA